MRKTNSAAKMKRSGSPRLARQDWIEGAFGVLAKHGVEGLRVEKLAQAMGVTKGSFYWHFRDRDELCEAVLEEWRRLNTYQLIEHVGQRRDAVDEIKSLVRLPLQVLQERTAPGHIALSADIALSLRLWGRWDPRVAKVLAEVDQLRVKAFSQLFVAAGTEPGESQARAVLLYAYMRTAMTLLDPRDRDLAARCESLLLGTDRES